MLEIIKNFNGFFWGVILIVLLVGTGIFYTFRLKFIQVREFKSGLKQLTSGFDLSGEKADNNGMSSFQALATAIAAQVGTGNLAGAATAIVSGGPGAIFWMWLSAFFGMATIYSEAVLSQIFKQKKDDEMTGGPAYYIETLFNGGKAAKFLAGFFSVACILSLGFMGNAVQANSVGDAFHNAFHVPTVVTGLFLAILSGFIFFGRGKKEIASVTEKVVPIMAVLYVAICLVIIVLNIGNAALAFKAIFVNAFSTKAVLGGFAGAGMRKAIRFGVARGLFSNEAGMGSTPHAHAIAKVKNPEDQGHVAIVTVFIDTFVILTLSALVILIADGRATGTGISLTQQAFQAVLGHFGVIFVAVALFFFAFSTIIGWLLFWGSQCKIFIWKESVKCL